MTPDQKERFKAKQRKYNLEHREELRAGNHARHKKFKSEHPEYREKCRERSRKYAQEHREELNKYHSRDLNSTGEEKRIIRSRSRHILFRSHSKLPGYQIHHCFTYDDPNYFIYIPRSLHLQIHRLLRDLKIPSDSDHWNVIKDLVNSCEEYKCIRCRQ